jgi:hypothetical protein
MVFRFRGIPVREINGLPYAVHKIGDSEWQIVIENCERYPAGYTFAPVYGSYVEALQALQRWPDERAANRAVLSGDDTGSAYLAQCED